MDFEKFVKFTSILKKLAANMNAFEQMQNDPITEKDFEFLVGNLKKIGNYEVDDGEVVDITMELDEAGIFDALFEYFLSAIKLKELLRLYESNHNTVERISFDKKIFDKLKGENEDGL